MKLDALPRHLNNQYLEIPMLDMWQDKDRIYIVYDYMYFPEADAKRNLLAYSNDGKELWRAEDIGVGSPECYTNIIQIEPLVVNNFAGYTCRIDEVSGKVLTIEFTK